MLLDYQGITFDPNKISSIYEKRCFYDFEFEGGRSPGPETVVYIDGKKYSFYCTKKDFIGLIKDQVTISHIDFLAKEVK